MQQPVPHLCRQRTKPKKRLKLDEREKDGVGGGATHSCAIHKKKNKLTNAVRHAGPCSRPRPAQHRGRGHRTQKNKMRAAAAVVWCHMKGRCRKLCCEPVSQDPGMKPPRELGTKVISACAAASKVNPRSTSPSAITPKIALLGIPTPVWRSSLPSGRFWILAQPWTFWNVLSLRGNLAL
jgi:hypothetical protein